MRALALILVACSAFAADKPALTQADAEQDMRNGTCGFDRKVGTGLVDGMGWLHQPVSGPVEVCTAEDGGTIQVLNVGAPAHCVHIDWLGGKPYSVIVKAAEPTRLRWKIKGYEWGDVPIGYQTAPRLREGLKP